MKARQFHDHLTSLGIPIEGVVSRADGSVRIDFASAADKIDRDRAMNELAQFDWSEPSAEALAEEEARQEFARLRPLVEAMIEALKDPTNATSEAVMQDTERKHREKKQQQVR